MPSGPSSSSAFPRTRSRARNKSQAVEQEAMQEALKPFHNPKLRKAILDARDS